MRVSEFCRIAGADLDHFKSLRRRDQLPFIDPVQIGREVDLLNGDPRKEEKRAEDFEAEMDAGKVSPRWSTFSISDAIRLRCQLDLMVDGGLEPSNACSIARGAGWSMVSEKLHSASTVEDFQRFLADTPEQWIGVEVSSDGTDRYRSNYGGTLSEIFMASEARANRDRSDFGGRRIRLVLVNVSGAIGFVLDRLAEAE